MNDAIDEEADAGGEAEGLGGLGGGIQAEVEEGNEYDEEGLALDTKEETKVLPERKHDGVHRLEIHELVHEEQNAKQDHVYRDKNVSREGRIVGHGQHSRASHEDGQAEVHAGQQALDELGVGGPKMITGGVSHTHE